MYWKEVAICSILSIAAVLPAPGRAEIVAGAPSERILGGIVDPGVAALVEEVLKQNPRLAAAEYRSRAALERAPQVGALADPTVRAGAYLAGPETRTGPQRLSVSLAQAVPWFGKLGLKRDVADHEAAAVAAEVEAMRLRLTTDSRRLLHELAFLGQHETITKSLRVHLAQHEEIARARYSTGVGLAHEVLKLQAELTRVDVELLEVTGRQTKLLARLNAMRDRDPSSIVALQPLPDPVRIDLSIDSLIEQALVGRPEVLAAEARLLAAEKAHDLAGIEKRPDFMVGLSYTLVDRRDDAVGIAMPPEGNGDDVLALQGGVTIPLWKKKITAGIDEAMEQRSAASEAGRRVRASVRADVGDLATRLSLSFDNLALVENLLIAQAEEALELAEAAYIAGNLNALDLLDAEHVLFRARIARARAAADVSIGLAELEGALAGPLSTLKNSEHGADNS